MPERERRRVIYAPTTYQEIAFDDKPSWLSARDQIGIGASEVSALFNDPANPLRGQSSYDSPLSVNWRKRGLIPRESRDDGEELNLEWSTFIEPAISAWFETKVLPEKDPFLTPHDPGQWTIQVPLDYGQPGCVPWFCTLDRVLLDEDGAPRSILELKNASLFMGGEWAEDPPMGYILQVQTQLAVTGMPYGYICAPIGGQAPRWKKIERSESLIAIIRHRVEDAWGAIQRKEDPPIDAHPKTTDAIIHRWPFDDGNRIDLRPEHARMWEDRAAANDRQKIAEAEYDRLTNELKVAIGESTFGDLPDGRSLSLKRDKRGDRILREVKS